MNDPALLRIARQMREAQATPHPVAQMMAKTYAREVNRRLDRIRARVSA